ncbi:MAG: hypothetical protein PVI57_03645 [Gemmatimonadota bacterium]|jgi:hypothetical protein
MTTRDELAALVKRHAGRPGAARLRSLLGEASPPLGGETRADR